MSQNLDRKIYVGNLPEAMTEQVLYTVFLTFGEIKNVEMPRDSGVPRHKGYGFVEFEETEDCLQAMDNMHEAELFGNIIKVQKARKTTGPMDRAIWEDKEYQEKYCNIDVEEKDKEIDENGELINQQEPTEKKKEKPAKPLTQLQTLYELAKAQGLQPE